MDTNTIAGLHGSFRGASVLFLLFVAFALTGCEGTQGRGEHGVEHVERESQQREPGPADGEHFGERGSDGEAEPAQEAGASEGSDPAVAAFLAELEGDGWRSAVSQQGHFTVVWRSRAGKVPRNREFDMDVYVLRDGQALENCQVRVRGWMPDHGHGLNRRPPVSEADPGRYLVEGMVLHMRGHWQVFFDVVHEGVGDIVEFQEDL